MFKTLSMIYMIIISPTPSNKGNDWISDVDAIEIINEQVEIHSYNLICRDNNPYPISITKSVSDDQVERYFKEGLHEMTFRVTYRFIAEHGCQAMAKKLAVEGVL